jgi:NAD(P) transhydrogenase subunit alpha
VLNETGPNEQRVAVVPESVPVLARAGIRVLAEPGAGAAAWFPDGAYQRAGAKVASRDEVIGGAGVLVSVGVPAPDLVARLRTGQAIIGMLRPLAEPELAGRLAGLTPRRDIRTGRGRPRARARRPP